MPPEPELAEEEVALPGEETPPEDPPAPPEGFVPVDKHQKDVNVQHKRFRDEERGRIKEKERADAAEAELIRLRGEAEKVVVPPPPEPYSDNYAAETAARDAAIVRQTEQNAANERAAATRRTEDEARQADQHAALQTRVAGFDKNMIGLGLKPVEVKAAADTFIANGASVAFQDDVLEDPDGPLLVAYFAANPLEAENVNGMSGLARANHINNDVRAKALLLKPKTSGAPPPPVTLEGGGAPETKETWERGAKYE